MGGAYQAAGHAHFVTNVLDFEMDVQAAIDAPRLFHFDGRIEAEDGFGDSMLEELRARGHAVAKANMPWGGGQAIRIDRARGVLCGGSDPRKDGCALGYWPTAIAPSRVATWIQMPFSLSEVTVYNRPFLNTKLLLADRRAKRRRGQIGRANV